MAEMSRFNPLINRVSEFFSVDSTSEMVNANVSIR